MPCSRESSQSRDWTLVSYVSCIDGDFFTTGPTREIETTNKKQMERLEGKSIVTTILKKIMNGRERGKDPVWNSLEEKKPLLTRIVVGGLWDANKYQTLKPLEANVRGEIMWAEKYYSKK